jgi:DNA-binding transcriptional LysR family regulator
MRLHSSGWYPPRGQDSVEDMSTTLDILSLSQLRCFIAVVDIGSFAGAARRLAMTTSGVSKTISRMESAYGLQLLHRSTHSVSLTNAGEQLVDLARGVVNRVEDIDEVLTNAQADAASGMVKISASPAFVRRCLTPLLPGLRALHPKITLDLRASDNTVDLADAGLDFAIRSGDVEGLPGHIRLPWFEFDWAVCAAPDYLELNDMPRSPQDLARHILIGFRNARTGLIENWRLRDQSFPATPNWAFVTDDAESALIAAINGTGIMWGPRWLVADSIANKTLTELIPDWRGSAMQMSILRRGQKQMSARVRTVIDFLRGSASLMIGS